MNDRDLICALRQLENPKVAVVGDFMLDHYVWGEATRISPEAPVPVVHASREDYRLGGAGNVAANLREMGASVACFGVCGTDQAGEAMLSRLQELGDCTGIIRTPDRPTTQKTRVMARSQQMLRVDREDLRSLAETDEAKLLERLLAAEWDAVILSDYGKGVIGVRVIETVVAAARERGVPSLVDPKHRDLSRYRGAVVATPNRVEAEAACGCALPDLEALQEHGPKLLAESGLEALLVTLGAEGMFLLRKESTALHLPTAARQVYDVTGAGDTVIATLAVALGGGLEWEASVRLANAAAGLAVAKVGTAAVGREELLHHLSAATSVHKIVPCDDYEALATALGSLRREGMRLVFTNGCFDILHAGHVRYLQESRRMGDALVIGVNNDESIRRLKGEDRPFNVLEDRCEVLAALECVDLVAPFGADTPEALIEAVCPDVLVKGADWKDQGVVGADFVEAHGGEVILVDLLPGCSTTGLADRIRGK